MESKILNLTTERWETLQDIEEIYNDKLPVPYVSTLMKHANVLFS